MKEVVASLEPLEGAMETLQWLQSRVPRAFLLTDTFQEYAMPMIEKLGYPCVFCHSVDVDEDGYITKHCLRLRDQKRLSVEAFQRLGHRIIAVGDSFNDISMLTAAEHGILFCPSQKVMDEHPEFPVVFNHADLRTKIAEIIGLSDGSGSETSDVAVENKFKREVSAETTSTAPTPTAVAGGYVSAPQA